MRQTGVPIPGEVQVSDSRQMHHSVQLGMSVRTRSNDSIDHRVSKKQRRGIATIWLVISAPALLMALCLAIEIGHLFLARMQLENSLESAAIAAVDRWAGGNTTADARMVGATYAADNRAGDTTVLLDTFEGGLPNGNVSCDGELVFGRVSGLPGQFRFEPSSVPGGSTGNTISLKVRILTSTDTKNDVANGSYSFTMFDYAASNPALQISSVLLDVSTVAETDLAPAYFDLRNPSGSGIATDRNFGIQPIFDFGGGVLSANATPSYASDLTSPNYSLSFTGFDTGDTFGWGVDTDAVGPDPGTGDNQYADKGGDFNGTAVTISFVDSGTGLAAGTIAGTLSQVAEHESILVISNQQLQSGDFGVRARKTITVSPICGNMFGIALPGFSVTSEAFALSQNGQRPRLIQVLDYVCP